MSASIVLVTEKPHVDRAILPIAQRLLGEHHVVYTIPTLYLGHFEFRYPRGLSRRDYPYVAEPKWKPREQGDFSVYRMDNGVVAKTSLAFRDALLGASEIAFACDPDPSGAIAFHTLLSEVLGAEAAGEERRAFQINSLDPASISQALMQAQSTRSPWFSALLAAGQCRRFFDYNFNTNALAILGDVLRTLGAGGPGVGISKYGLQLLYHLRTQGAQSDSALASAMAQWQGTGRYDEETGLGSPASRWKIHENLLDAGLVVEGEGNGRSRMNRLSHQGERFLAALHPDCEDADLPFRIRQWGESWPASRPNVERYLRTFFGKAARFKPKAPTNDGMPFEATDEDPERPSP